MLMRLGLQNFLSMIAPNRLLEAVLLDKSDPALVVPTIAAKPPPPSKELFQSRKTRFKMSKTTESSDNATMENVLIIIMLFCTAHL